jgi:uncharacterized protein YndB with AHSA1/START domain
MTIARAGLLVLAALAALVALVALVGTMLPRDHVESRSATVPGDPDAVFATIADPAGYTAWRRSLSAVEVLPPVDGRGRWIEVSGGDRIAMEQVERAAPHRLVTRIADPDLPFGGTWTFELAPEPGATRVTITERGEIRNPIFRAVARFVFGYGATMETFLDELRARFYQPAAPVRTPPRAQRGE